MEEQAARLAAHLLTVSEDEKRYFESLGARRVKVVPNGVDCESVPGTAHRLASLASLR